MRKWPKVTQRIWLWMYQEEYFNFPGKQWLAINLPWPALKSKQHIELFDIISCQQGGGGNLFYCCVYNIHVTKHNLVLQIIKNISPKHLSWICQSCRLFLKFNSIHFLILLFLNAAWSADSGQIIHFCISNQFNNILVLCFANMAVNAKLNYFLWLPALIWRNNAWVSAFPKKACWFLF